MRWLLALADRNARSAAVDLAEIHCHINFSDEHFVWTELCVYRGRCRSSP